VPYSLTEEFVAVYRMHPLMPEDVAFHSVATDAAISRMGLPDLVVAPGAPGQPRERLEAIGYANALYSLGVANPGAITLHNFPRFLQSLERGDTGEIVDVGAADILRIRESRLPRYNDFRRLFRLPPAASFTDLTDNRRWAEQIREVYDDDLEAVDLMIGLFGEPRPRGLAFSQTAFRVFLLMAARRLQSDRFFTRDYTAETYTPTGLDWIDRTSMADVLRRHHPELGPALEGVDNAFVPWRRARRERPTPRSP
jgi:hypothetical protein